MKKQPLLCAALLALTTAPAFAQYTLTTLTSFNGSDGIGPGELTLIGINIYGPTNSGGTGYVAGLSAGYGTVFSLPIAGGTPTTLGNFNGSTNGANPGDGLSGLILVGSTFYGTTDNSGSSNNGTGTVFTLPMTGGTPTTLATFSTEVHPNAVTAVGSTLYGTAEGAAGNGGVFSLPITGGTPTTLANFNGANGSGPRAGLIVVGSTLYGTTVGGGTGSAGTVFSLPITGGTPTSLASFNGSNGFYPFCDLIVIGDTLYGTTNSGGTYNEGNVFSLPITGGTPTNLASFNGNDGALPFAGLTVIGDTLYGTTSAGGANGDGVVFSVPITGGTPTDLISFDGDNGANPYCGLIADAEGDLYGTTRNGGANGDGTVFELIVPEPGSLSLLALGGIGLLARRRQRARLGQ